MDAIVILMDITVLAIEFGNVYDIETTYKSALYSIKLNLEFPILNQLRDLFQKRRCSCGYPAAGISHGNAAGRGNRPLHHRDSIIGHMGLSEERFLNTEI